jgi:oligopeptide transport system ATP-binding protein
MAEKEVILRVEHLEQFFKMGKQTLKAVNDINFEVYKGEVFGIVGESGCGKTTTGRSIIRLYNITGGSIYFNGHRIGAGIRFNKEIVANAKAANKAEVASLKEELNKKIAEGGDAAALKADFDAKVKEADDRLSAVVTEQTAKIKAAKHDQKYCNKDYADKKIAEVEEKYQPLLAAANGEEQKAAIEAEYKQELALAKTDRIMNKMQMIFQDPIASLNPRMTVREIIAEGLIIRGIKDKQYIDEQVFKVLDMVGLVAEHANRYPHEFSGGQRQRIGIARSIVLNPELIIADEPISALDVSIQAQVINLLNELRHKLGLTIIFIAHDLSVVKYFSDRIAVMYFGKIVELTTSEELFAHPLHPYTRSLLSAIPMPDPHFEKQRKRITYNPIAVHDYSVDPPSMREVKAGHFVYCNEVEFQRYQQELATGVEIDVPQKSKK